MKNLIKYVINTSIITGNFFLLSSKAYIPYAVKVKILTQYHTLISLKQEVSQSKLQPND